MQIHEYVEICVIHTAWCTVASFRSFALTLYVSAPHEKLTLCLVRIRSYRAGELSAFSV